MSKRVRIPGLALGSSARFFVSFEREGLGVAPQPALSMCMFRLLAVLRIHVSRRVAVQVAILQRSRVSMQASFSQGIADMVVVHEQQLAIRGACIV